LSKYLLALFGAVVLVGVCGCSHDDTAAAAAAPAGPAANAPDRMVGQDPNANVKVLHGPGTVEDAKNGYVIKPPDPNNPAYKADPRMGGGG